MIKIATAMLLSVMTLQGSVWAQETDTPKDDTPTDAAPMVSTPAADEPKADVPAIDWSKVDWSKQDVKIILYDADTIARINTPKTKALPQHPPKAEAKAKKPIEKPKPQFPRDLSGRYTEIDKGIPLIINPEPCAPDGTDIRITVENIEDAKGFIVADLHNDKVEDFLESDKVVLRIRAKAKLGETRFCLPLAAPGEYAVAVYHDKNDNRKFDKNFLGIPKERFGMSANPKFGLKSPEYAESAVQVPEQGTDITITLHSSGDILKGSK